MDWSVNEVKMYLLQEIVHGFSFGTVYNEVWKLHNTSFIIQTSTICRLKRYIGVINQ